MTWKDAVIEACIVNHLSWDENDPKKTLANLIAWEVKIALDPLVSEEANELIEKGMLMALTDEQRSKIETLHRDLKLKSATIAKRLGLVHELVQAYLKYRARTCGV